MSPTYLLLCVQAPRLRIAWASFAGQQDTFLWVQGSNEVLEKIKLWHVEPVYTSSDFLSDKNGVPSWEGIDQRRCSEDCGCQSRRGDVYPESYQWRSIESGHRGQLGDWERPLFQGLVIRISLLWTRWPRRLERMVSLKECECIYDPVRSGVIHADTPPERRETPLVWRSRNPWIGKICKESGRILWFASGPLNGHW